MVRYLFFSLTKAENGYRNFFVKLIFRLSINSCFELVLFRTNISCLENLKNIFCFGTNFVNFSSFADAIPVKEVVTNELPVQSPGPSVTPPAVTVTIRKIPFSLRHKGKSKDFHFAETKSIGDLHVEISRLSGTCMAPYTVPFRADIDTKVLLKTLDLPSANKVVLQCVDDGCHKRFNSEMLVASVSTEEQLMGMKAKYRELSEEKIKLEKELAAKNMDQVRAKALIGRLRQEIRKKNERISKLGNTSLRLTKEKRKQLLENYLSPFFSPAMIDCYFKGKWKCVRNWSEEDICFALTLRLLNKKTYVLLRQRKLPLPGLSTLRKHMKVFKLTEGNLEPMFRLLEIWAARLTPLQKVIGVMFDEVFLKFDIAYNAQQDQIVGPYRKVNVMMARSIFDCENGEGFKAPIWFGYDTVLRKAKLLDMINKLRKIGYQVVFCTGDMGNEPLGNSKSLKITADKPYFFHPDYPEDKIFFFYDVPHLIKLLRNAMFNYGFILPDGTKVDKQMFLEVKKVLDEGGDVNAFSKLKNVQLFEVRSMDKQRVKYACQLLSATMSDFVKFNFGHKPDFLKMAEMVSKVNNWFDCLNSNKEMVNRPFKCAYEVHLDSQRQVLHDMRNYVQNIKVLNARNKKCDEIKLMPWQRGIAISCSGLEMLFDMLVEKFRISSLKAYRLCQDPVEQCFGILRAMGLQNDRMDPVQFVYRLSQYCMGVGQDLIIENANIEFTTTKAKIITPDIVNIPNLANEITAELPVPLKVEYWNDGIEDVVEPHQLVEALTIAEADEPQPSTSLNKNELAGFDRIGGWLAYKDAPELSTPGDKPFDKEVFVDSEWVKLRNDGHLDVTTHQFQADLIKMDIAFREFHTDARGPGKVQFTPNDLSRAANVTKDFAEILIRDFPQYSQKLLARFARGRTFFRLRHLKKEIRRKETLRSKRKVNEFADGSVPAKKQKVEKVKKVVKKVVKGEKAKSGFLASVNENSSSDDSDSELDPEIFCDSSDDDN